MKYKDKNGYEWSIEKGDWLGSFDKVNNRKSIILTKFSIPVILLVILCLFLLS